MTHHRLPAFLIRWSVRLSCSALAVTAAMARADAQVTSASAAALRAGIRLEMSEVAAVERGDAIARVVPTQDQRDVAVFGVVRLGVSRDVYLRQVQDFRTSLRTPARARLGVFSDPAMPADVADMVVAKDDARDLRDCRPGDCTTKMPASDMQRVQAQVDWSSPDWIARVTSLTRLRVLQIVAEYRAHGNSAMPTYDDRRSVRGSDAFLGVLQQSQFLVQSAPEIAGFFRTYPNDRPAGVADVLFWSEDVVARLRPIFSITHLMVYTPPGISGTTVRASKQIYANHYFEAAIEVVNAIDRDVAGEPAATYVVVERRFRFDNLPTGGILNIRGRAVNGLRQQLLADLQRERAAAERTAQRTP